MEATQVPAESSPAPPPAQRAWRKEVWVPIWLLAAHALFALLLSPMGTSVPDNVIGVLAPASLIGVMLSQPLLCALWAAWAWPPVVWRVPLGMAACALLGLAADAKAGDVQTLLLYAMLLVVFLAVLATTRYAWGWKLILTRASGPCEEPTAPERFSMRYLLVWTTIVAGLAALGGVIESASTSRGDLSIGVVLTSVALFAAMLLPIVVAGVLVLGRTRRWLVSLVGLPLMIGGVSYGAAVVYLATYPVGVPFGQMFVLIAGLMLGATGSMLLSALALRLAGYRVIREPRRKARHA